MTPAREQAREAARIENDRLGSEQMQASAEHYANVASDVWVSYVRKAKQRLDALHFQDPVQLGFCATCSTPWPCKTALVADELREVST